MLKAVVGIVLVLLANIVQSAPTSGVYNIAGDPKYDLPESTLKAGLVCPGGYKQKNLVLLVPGTGETTIQFYNPNFGQLLPANGFSICYLVIPSLSLGDAQVTSEFVSYAINYLYAINNRVKIRVLSHSQGGPNVQWSLTFWKSTRSKVASWVAIAADYKGTVEGPFLAAVEDISEAGTYPSVIQQSVGSNYLKALASHGGTSKPFVPTNNIYTYTDEVVEPEQLPTTATSYLPGAFNLAVQQLCPDRTPEHFLVVVDTITQFFALQAFSSSSGLASLSSSKFTAAEKTQLCLGVLPYFKSVGAAINYGLADLNTALAAAVVSGTYKTTVEPPLKSYAA